MRLAALLVAFFASAAPLSAYAQAGLQVTPVVIQMPQQRGVSSMRVHNGRDRETAFEVQAFLWTQDNGETVLTPTQDLVVAPSTFLAPANGDQIVRLALAPARRQGAVEQSYRVLLRELPDPAAPVNGFRLVVEMSMPVFVAPPNARGTLTAMRGRDADGRPAIVLANTGAAHVTLSDAPDGARVENLPRYLLAGQHITRPLPGGAVQLVTATVGDTAPRIQTIEWGDAPLLADSR